MGGAAPSSGFTYGVKVLDQLYSSALIPGTTILIAGHPGAGKTTFAAGICYKNALNGIPSLYISFIEDKDKFMNFMGRIGFPLEELERKGLFKYAKLPILTDEEILTELTNKIYSEIVKGGYKIVVIDSITPIMTLMKGPEVRSVIQNFFYKLSRMISGLLVLVAELPYGTGTVPIEDAEFVADIVIMMKHRVERARLVRIMEIRKMRGAPVNVAEIPFAIREGEGIRVFVPPILQEANVVDLTKTYKLPCRLLKEVFGGHYHPGAVVSIITPPDGRFPVLAFIPMLRTVIDYDLKVSMVSFRYTAKEAIHYFTEAMKDLGLGEFVDKIRKQVVSSVGVNPSGYSIEELIHILLDIINESKPDVLFLHGVEMLFLTFENIQRPFLYLFNVLQHNKSLGITTVMYSTYVNDNVLVMLKNLSDIVFEETYDYEKQNYGVLKPLTYVWKVGRRPYRLRYEDIMECIEETYKPRGD